MGTIEVSKMAKEDVFFCPRSITGPGTMCKMGHPGQDRHGSFGEDIFLWSPFLCRGWVSEKTKEFQCDSFRGNNTDCPMLKLMFSPGQTQYCAVNKCPHWKETLITPVPAHCKFCGV